MNKQTTILKYNKYSGIFFTILKLLVVSDQTYYLHLYYFRMTWRALNRYISTILCIVIISMLYCLTETSFSLDHLCHVHGASLTWWPCLPISFLFFTGTCSTFLGMCASIQMSLVRLLVVSSRHLCDMSWSGVLLIILLLSEIFILIEKYNVLSMYYDETIRNWRLWWLLSSVVCGILFKASILVVSFGLHQWIQLVDRIFMYLAQLAFCSDYREVARQRFLSMFSHSSP